MELIDILLVVVHVLMALLLVIAVLLQSGKGGGLGAGFGGASSAATQIFGGRGAGNFLSRSTVTFAIIFMCTSLGLAMRSTKPRSVLDFEGEDIIAAQEDPILEEGTGPELAPAPKLNTEEPSGELKIDSPSEQPPKADAKVDGDQPAAKPPAEIKADDAAPKNSPDDSGATPQ